MTARDNFNAYSDLTVVGFSTTDLVSNAGLPTVRHPGESRRFAVELLMAEGNDANLVSRHAELTFVVIQRETT